MSPPWAMAWKPVDTPSEMETTAMFKVNEANWDRSGRVVLGLFVLWLGFGSGALAGGAALGLNIVGGVLLITGIVGFCPLYKVLGLSTCSR